MNEEIQVNRMQLDDDINLVVPLFDQYRIFYGQVSDITGAEEFIRGNLDKEESVIFAAFKHGEAGDKVALGFVQLFPSKSSISMKRLWILNDLYVHPSARNQGIGRMLMNAAKEHAIVTKAKGLTLSTAHSNLNAQHLYVLLGYKRDEEFYAYHLYF